MSDLEEWPHIFDFPRTEKFHVKLCCLGEDAWNVFAEGLIYGECDEDRNTFSLIVEDGSAEGSSVILRSVIRPPVAFQKQDTVLLWNGPEKDVDFESLCPRDLKPENGLYRLAIGFPAAGACASICEFILYSASHLPNNERITFTVQHLAGADADYDGMLELIESPIVLPPLPTALNLTIVRNTISDLMGSLLGRELLIIYLDNMRYLDRLWDLFETITNGGGHSESSTNQSSGQSSGQSTDVTKTNRQHRVTRLSALERIQILWTISDIVKQYCLVGDSILIEELIDAERFSKVLCMLEYDRAFGTRKANFRDFYGNNTGMKQVFEITDVPIAERIRRTFRLQLLRDVLVRSADDSTFHVLRSLIFVSHSEILEKLQSSSEFCDLLFSLFDDASYGKEEQEPGAYDKIKDDAIRFINEIMKVSKTLPYAQLKALILTMINSGLVNALTYGFDVSRSAEINMMALEALSVFLEFDVSFILPFRDTLIKLILKLAVRDKNVSMPKQEEQQKQQQHKQEQTASTMTVPLTRALSIEIVEILKKVLLELPGETMQAFFVVLQNVFVDANRASEHSAVALLPFLEILTHCFACHPEITGALMKEHDIWNHLAQQYSITEALTSPNSPSPSLEPSTKTFRKDHPRAQCSMALIRLVREAIQPLAMTSTMQCAEQANCIIGSGLFRLIVWRHIRDYMHNKHSTDAEQSSFINLLYTIVEGKTNTTAQQYRVFTNWMANEGLQDTRTLCEKYRFLSSVLPEPLESETMGNSLLKRTSGSQQQGQQQGQQGQADSTGSHSPRQAQRIRFGSPFSSRNHQIVDEIDEKVYVLPPKSFSNHFAAEESSNSSENVNGRASLPTHNGHPWWDSPRTEPEEAKETG